jgi:hypothetical protein
MSRRRRIAAVLAMLHIAVVIAICAGETARLIRSGLTVVPITRVRAASSLELPARSTAARWLVRLRRTYLHAAGVESGYGFFAPNIPPFYRLSVTVGDEHGTLQQGILSPTRGEKDLRLASFLDSLGRRAGGDVRNVMFTLLGEALFAEHPRAASIRVQVDKVTRPDIRRFRRGEKETTELAYAYEFRREMASAAD